MAEAVPTGQGADGHFANSRSTAAIETAQAAGVNLVRRTLSA